MPAFGVLRLPPFQQDRKALIGRLDGPIKLRGEIINPAAREPFARVGVEFRIGVEALNLLRITRTPYSKGADAELDGRPGGLDGVVNVLDERVDVFAPPILARNLAPGAEPPPARVVGKIQLFARAILFFVGIKIIVEVDAVYVVAPDDIHDDAQRVVLHRFLTGIEPEIFSVLADELRARLADMSGGDGRSCGRNARAIGVEPGVQLETALVGLL